MNTANNGSVLVSVLLIMFLLKMSGVVILLLLLVVSSEGRVADVVLEDKLETVLECVHYDTQNKTNGDKKEVCKMDTDEDGNLVEHFCYTTWSNINTTDPGHSSGIMVHKQGCIDNLGSVHKNCKNKTECVATDDPRNKVLLCCCNRNNCNQEFRFEPVMVLVQNTTSQSQSVEGAVSSKWFLLLYTLVPLFVFLVIIAAGCYVYHHRKHARFNSLSSLGEDTPAGPPTPNLNHRPVQLLEIKARGRFGAVWKGQLGKDMVAVKIFPLQDKQSWFAEQEIYNLPQMAHENILSFLGIQTRGESLQMEFWLVSSFHEHGSLCDFLKTNIISWEDLVKISVTMARGLAHLHAEVPSNKGSGIKPAVAHRDFKSKNVLIRSDMSACIGDFGLALQFKPTEVVGDTHGQVGTRRYMAPEVLEGAINFSRDAFLRIDMYACGLVLWEIATRCTVLETPSEYKLPFEMEASPHPSLEEICELVVTKKVRPTLYKPWRAHPGLSILCETVEECWDHDAEARLSSSCVVERLQQMKTAVGEGMSDQVTVNNHINSYIQQTNNTPPEEVLLIPLNQSSDSAISDESTESM